MMAFSEASKLEVLPLYPEMVQNLFEKHPYPVLACILLLLYVYTVRSVRFRRINAIKKNYGFTSDPKSYKHMTMEQAQEIERNLAEWDFPFLYEFGWLFDFLRPSSSPILSDLLVRTGHFSNPDPMIAHKRQSDTVCLMAALIAQPLKSEYNSLALARINVHHQMFPNQINSDTVLYLVWMFWRGPVTWINRVGWRKMEDFEIQATWMIWREVGIRMGVKYMPEDYRELLKWKDDYRKEVVYPSPTNTIINESILGMMLYMVPGMLKPLARRCVMALLDEEILWACGWETPLLAAERPYLRAILFTYFHLFGIFQGWFCLPRSRRYIRSPQAPNPDTGMFNFPEYTYKTTPYYVRKTLYNSWGPFALYARLVGIALPAPEFKSSGTRWEEMGPKKKMVSKQVEAETSVRKQAEELMAAEWGFRAKVPFQPQPLVKPMSDGYGSRDHAYPLDVEPSTIPLPGK